MKPSTFFKLLACGQASLLSKRIKANTDFHHASCTSAALSSGVYANFTNGKANFDYLSERLAVSNREALRAWLELGVSLGELKRSGDEPQIKGSMSKSRLESKNDAYRALLQEIIELPLFLCGGHTRHAQKAGMVSF